MRVYVRDGYRTSFEISDYLYTNAFVMREKILYLIIIVSISLMAGIIAGRYTKKETTVEKPVVIEKPIHIVEYVEKYDTVCLVQVKKIPDTVHHTTTLTVHDTVEVIVPIYVQLYDTTFNDIRAEIQISGFNASLDRITLTNYRIPTQTVITSDRKHFGLGIGVGYGIPIDAACKGEFRLSPTFSINLSYNLFTF